MRVPYLLLLLASIASAHPVEPGTASIAGKGNRFTQKQETVPAEKHEKNVTPPKNEAHTDHKIPRAKGGKADLDNGQILCRDCNLKKSDKTE